MSTDAKKEFQSKIINRIANSVYPNEMARYEPSHLDLHYLHRCLFGSAQLEGLREKDAHSRNTF